MNVKVLLAKILPLLAASYQSAVSPACTFTDNAGIGFPSQMAALPLLTGGAIGGQAQLGALIAKVLEHMSLAVKEIDTPSGIPVIDQIPSPISLTTPAELERLPKDKDTSTDQMLKSTEQTGLCVI